MVKIIENEMNFVIMITDHAWFSINKFDKREEIALVIEETDRPYFFIYYGRGNLWNRCIEKVETTKNLDLIESWWYNLPNYQHGFWTDSFDHLNDIIKGDYNGRHTKIN